MQERTCLHIVIERIHALREQTSQGGMDPKRLREAQRQIVYWRRQLAKLLSPEGPGRRAAAPG